MMSNNSIISILIVDDHPGIRRAIRLILNRSPAMKVIGEAGDGISAFRLAHSLKPDVVILDVELPKMRGDLVVKRLNKNHPEIKVLAMSSYNDPNYIHGMIQNGALGYLLKDEVPELLAKAVQKTAQGVKGWISRKSKRRPNSKLRLMLTRRERLLAEGLKHKSLSALSKRLSLSDDELQSQIQDLATTVGCATLEELIEQTRKNEIHWI